MTLVISKGLTLDNGTRAAAIAGVSPTLDYRFAREKREIETVSLTDKLTYTGGNGTFVGSDGFIQLATTNVPRFDHDPLSRQSLGLLSEVERTNGIRNNTMVGAVAGTPGTNPTNWNIQQSVTGLTFQVVSVGTESGIKYIDIRASGTPSASGTILIQLEQSTTNAAAQGETWVISSYCRLMAGTLPSTLNLRARIAGSGGSVTLSQTAIVPTSSPLISQRFTHVASLDNASTEFINARIDASVISGVAVDFTLRIGLPQLEKGATASTPIPTTTTAVTRTADSAVIDGTGVLTGTYTLVEKPAGCAVVSGSNINLQPGFTAERVMVFPAALDAGQITAIRGAM
jgi:hypothetical protein